MVLARNESGESIYYQVLRKTWGTLRELGLKLECLAELSFTVRRVELLG